MSNRRPLRYVLIGCAASIATAHIDALARVPGAVIAGTADIDVTRGTAVAATVGCPYFPDHRALLAATTPDVAVICTPHPLHAAQALDCFAAGAHVLTEKPMAVEVAEGDRMLDAAASAGRMLAVNFQQRFRPVVEAARALIVAGELGALVRVLCIEPWFRTDAYYRSAGWRSTWQGEGGGVLVNQAPHTLDLLCYLAGLPMTLWGVTRTVGHATECEDIAHALLEYANGAPGYLHTNTVEVGEPQRLEIVGDKLALTILGDTLTVKRVTPSLSAFSATSEERFSAPEVTIHQARYPAIEGTGHLAVHRDLFAAITDGRAPRCDGRQALQSLELANAVILSSFSGRRVTLPLDRGAYSVLLADLRSGRRPPHPSA